VKAPLSPAVRPPHPLVFAHRGGRALAPENTIAAFDLGLQAGADGLELDVRLSRDGVPVVHHDADLDRCTDGTGPIDRITAVDLARFDAGHRFEPDKGHPWRGRGAAIPTLEDVLRRYPAVPVIIEIKTYTREAAHAVVRCVVAAQAAARVCIGAFDLTTLRAVRSLAPALATGAAQAEVRWAMLAASVGVSPWRRRYRAVQVPEAVGATTVVTHRLVERLNAVGVPVQVWTVNEASDMVRLLDWGVAGLITDRPDLAVDVRARWLRHRHS
jgi:glycerophosphoryl diester phosphodiesterase